MATASAVRRVASWRATSPTEERPEAARSVRWGTSMGLGYGADGAHMAKIEAGRRYSHWGGPRGPESDQEAAAAEGEWAVAAGAAAIASAAATASVVVKPILWDVAGQGSVSGTQRRIDADHKGQG